MDVKLLVAWHTEAERKREKYIERERHIATFSVPGLTSFVFR